MLNLQFKFHPQASASERTRILKSLAQHAEVEQVFPGQGDDDLASLYTARVADDASFPGVLRRLQRSRKVVYAEPEAARALYLPPEVEDQTAARRR